MALARRATIVTDTARELREMIFGGKVKPGEFFPPQKTLAARFGVGLSTIHEAFQVLTAAGLVQSCPGKGTWVSQDALDTLVHPVAVKSRLGDVSFQVLHEARSTIEVTLSELAARRATPEDLDRIWSAVRALEELESAGGDDQSIGRADLEFHLAVAKAGHNELLEQFYHLAFRMFSEFLSELVLLPQVDLHVFPVRNRALAEAIQERSPRKARQAALNIIKDVDRLLDSVVGENGGK